MKISPETARYWYKQCILNRRGFALHAVYDEQEFGLERISLLVDLDDKFLPYARDIFNVLHNFLGLTYYVRSLPSGTFVNTYQIPKGHQDELAKTLNDLKAEQVLKKFEVMPITWRRIVPMQTKYYNFTKGVWDFDWAKTVEVGSDELPPLISSKPVKFDYEDLMIVKELQTSATRSLQSIAKVLKMDYDVAYRHYTHVMKRGMIVGYRIRWMETSIKQGGNSQDWRDILVYHAQHKYQMLMILLKNLKEEEQTLVMRRLSRLPFLVNLNGGDGCLYFELGVPYAYQSEVLHFLHEVLSPYRDSLTFLLSDQTYAVGMTIPYELYDKETGTWTMRSAECSAAFKNLLPKIERLRKASS